VKFAFIAGMAEENERKPREERFSVTFMCEMLEVTRQGFYAWKKRVPSARAAGDEKLAAVIAEIHKENEGRYGIDRIHRELARRGHRAGPRRVRRLARAAGLACVHPRPYKATTVQDTANQAGLVDLVGREFVPGAKDELWYGDITYIFTMTGWAYLATVIDGYSRKVVGWAVAGHITAAVDRDLDGIGAGHGRGCLAEGGAGITLWRQLPEARGNWRGCRDHASLWNRTIRRQPLAPA
jgi:putative transposase